MRAPITVLELLEARTKMSEPLRNQLGVLATEVTKMNWFRSDWIRSPDVSITTLTSHKEEAERLWEELLKVHSYLTGKVSMARPGEISGYPELDLEMLDTWTDDWVDMVEKEVSDAEFLVERLYNSGWGPTADLSSLMTPPNEEGLTAVAATLPSRPEVLQQQQLQQPEKVSVKKEQRPGGEGEDGERKGYRRKGNCSIKTAKGRNGNS